MADVSRLAIIVGLFLINVSVILAQAVDHPYCPDLGPPFSSVNRHRLCLYREYGCCTDGQDLLLLEKYIEFNRQLRKRGYGYQCNGLIVALLCENCSPISGQLFNVGQSIPRLCGDRCGNVHSLCAKQLKLVIELTTNDTALMESLSSAQSFCALMTPSSVQPELCFPESEMSAKQVQSSPRSTETQCFCVKQIAENLRNPLTLRNARDGSKRIFVAEQIGVVHVFLPDGSKLSTPFLDISSRVLISQSTADERGFLNIEFHPGHFVNGKFYVFYCVAKPGGGFNTRVSEFEVEASDNNVANPNSERILLEIDQPYGNHNGGELLFGDDGYLYIFSGDGGAGGDPQNNAQNKSSLLGKVLRIDVDSRNSSLPYGIPADNPFVSDSEYRPEIYALGVRNIWRCGKDPGDSQTDAGKGRVICGDVGQNKFEELDVLVKGANYGWRGREGFECFDRNLCGQIGPEELPIHTYGRTVGQSIVGGNFYRGCESPNLNGYYLYADTVSGDFFKLHQQQNGQWTNEPFPFCASEVCMNGLQSFAERFVLSFGQDEDGEVYFMSTDSLRSSHPGGKLYKVVDPYRRGNPDRCGRSTALDPRVSLGRISL